MSLRRLTLIEWLVLAVIVVILVALLIPGGRSTGSGQFDLKVTLQEELVGDCKVRWGLIRHERFGLAVESGEENVVSWYSDLPQADGPRSYRILYDVFGRQTWTGWKYKTVYQFDTVLVEYALPDGKHRYRGMPINRRKGQQLVTIEVPRDPPPENTLITPLPAAHSHSSPSSVTIPDPATSPLCLLCEARDPNPESQFILPSTARSRPMPTTSLYDFDIAVIGAGHAGCEAALAAARLGARTVLLTMNCDTVGQMSCNPAIGGVAKGQIVREIDALGGEMGRVIDATGLQFRMLNRSKGAAMHSPRAQADKKAYQFEMKRRIEDQPGLTLRQETVEGLLVERRVSSVEGEEALFDAQRSTLDARITGVAVRGGGVYRCRAVIVTTGTFLQAIMHTGEAKTAGGRAGDGTVATMSDSLRELGFELQRFKTGTPCRLNGRTIDYSVLEEQPGDADPQPFSFLTHRIEQSQLPCWLTETNSHVHELIRANLHRAPMYSGQIQSTGPRYCPSIEDKVVRFAEKDSHHIFLEPEGRNTWEIYCNGISTSLPRDVQDELIRSVRGLDRAEIMRYGYAVEYDYAPPTQLQRTLETKRVAGLYFAGQINGTTGYEEAAGQGLLAGINAALKLKGEPPLIIDRSQAYLGVLIDDLVTRGVDEPYRMFTSRAEYRLLLRQDNADRRLTPLGRRIGLVTDERWRRFEQHEAEIAAASHLLGRERHEGPTLEEWLRRPEVDWMWLAERLSVVAELSISDRAREQVEIEVKYAGYIRRQTAEIEKHQKTSSVRIPPTFDYQAVPQLRREAKEKLSKVKPADLGQAGRISGITPADLTVLMLYLREPERLSGSATNQA